MCEMRTARLDRPKWGVGAVRACTHARRLERPLLVAWLGRFRFALPSKGGRSPSGWRSALVERELGFAGSLERARVDFALFNVLLQLALSGRFNAFFSRACELYHDDLLECMQQTRSLCPAFDLWRVSQGGTRWGGRSNRQAVSSLCYQRAGTCAELAWQGEQDYRLCAQSSSRWEEVHHPSHS